MSFTLRNLNFGDERTLDTNLVQHETINQQSIVFRPTTFFDTQVLVLEYISVSYANKEAFIAYMKINAGKEVHLTDYQGNRYTGFIITPKIDFHVFAKPSLTCMNDKGTYSFRFEFAITGTF